MRNGISANHHFGVKALIVFLLLFSFTIGCEQKTKNEMRTSELQKGESNIGLQDKLYDVAVVGEDNVWCVGYFGAIFHSPDGGSTWIRKKSGVSEALLGVSFAGENEGWVVGASGLILHTTDQGETWEKQDSSVPDQKLLKVQFINTQKGWAVGTGGCIIHTVNGGKSWERLPFDQDVILNDVHFINENEGWVAGEFETIIHTVDGGKTWEVQIGDGLGILFGISMRPDGLRGIAVGTEGVIYFTEDGGANWRHARTPGDDTLLKVNYYDDVHAIAVGLRGCLTSTADAGQSWTALCLPSHFTWLSGIAFTNGGFGYLVGDAGKILMSKDKGQSWMPYSLAQ